MEEEETEKAVELSCCVEEKATQTNDISSTSDK